MCSPGARECLKLGFPATHLLPSVSPLPFGYKFYQELCTHEGLGAAQWLMKETSQHQCWPGSGLAKVRASSPQLLYLPYAGRCSEFLLEKGLLCLCPCWVLGQTYYQEHGAHSSESGSWPLSGVESQMPALGC